MIEPRAEGYAIDGRMARDASWHLPDLVRGLCAAAVAPVLLWFMLTSGDEWHTKTWLAWVLFVAFAGVFGAAAARVLLVNARDPNREVFVFRTRQSNVVAETIMAGMGALLLVIACITFIDLGIEGPGTKTPLAGVVLLPMAVALLFWRPQFALDTRRRTLRRYPFGRGIPLRHQELPYQVHITAEGYYVGQQTRQKIGSMIRGVTSGGTFELELVPNGAPPEILEARKRAWQGMFTEMQTS